MKKEIKLIAGILAFVLILGGAYILYQKLSGENLPENIAAHEEQREIAAAPDFTVFDENGTPVRLSDFRGKPVVLNFWASWCPPCKSEMPDFDAAYAKYGDEVQFMMVNVTDGGRETQENAAAFIEEQGYRFPVFYDTTLEAATAYNASSIPVTYFIDVSGNLVVYGAGALNMETLEQGIEMLLP